MQQAKLIEPAALKRRAKALGITQQALAEATGAAQSQVSRALNGGLKRRDGLYSRLCNYVIMQERRRGLGTSRPDLPSELLDSLAAAWDGTPGHATRLSHVLKALGAL